MKRILLPLILPVALITGIIYSCAEALSQREKVESEKVNALSDDGGFVSKYGHLPNENTNEVLRIGTHLEYVDNLLRSKSTEGLTASPIPGPQSPIPIPDLRILKIRPIRVKKP